MQRAKISFIILAILFHSFILSPDGLARDCTMYEPLYGIWEFTTALGYGTRTITLDEFDCNTLEYSFCLCGESDGEIAFAGGGYTVRVHSISQYGYINWANMHMYTFTFLDANTVSGTYTAIVAGDVFPEDDFIGVKTHDFNTTTTTTSISPTTTSIPSPNLVFKNHMMTKDPKYNSQCEAPKRDDTFYHDDEAAHCWMLWHNASGKETIKSEWYKPDGELYRDVSTQSEYVNGCWYPFIGIDGYEPAYTSGNWRVDVYVGGNKRFSEYFIIEGLTSTSTSTTTSIITTTTTTMMPPPAPTKQMSSFSMRVTSSDS